MLLPLQTMTKSNNAQMMNNTFFILLSFIILVSCNEKNIEQKTSKILETATQKENSIESKTTVKPKTDTAKTKLETTIISILKAYQNKDEKTLNRFINKDLGIIFLFRMGAYDNLNIDKNISFAKPTPQYLPYANEIDTDYKISKTTLPVFSCDTENWDKPPGIYLDTTHIDHSLSQIAIIENKLNEEKIWSDIEIEKLKNLEKNSHKIIVIGKNNIEFIFYLTKINDKWYLSAIDRNEVCTA